jgi:hypothetical protein
MNIKKPFLKNYSSLPQVLTNKPLAALGDAYVNFVYSLAPLYKNRETMRKESERNSAGRGGEKSRVEEVDASRINKHILSDAAEALLVYAWLNDFITLEESVEALEKNDNLEKGLMHLLLTAKEKIKL